MKQLFNAFRLEVDNLHFALAIHPEVVIQILYG